MSLVMENLLDEIYKGTKTPYWGDTIPVSVVRQLINQAELRTEINILDILDNLIDGYGKLGMQDEAKALNLAYQRINERNLI